MDGSTAHVRRGELMQDVVLRFASWLAGSWELGGPFGVKTPAPDLQCIMQAEYCHHRHKAQKPEQASRESC